MNSEKETIQNLYLKVKEVDLFNPSDDVNKIMEKVSLLFKRADLEFSEIVERFFTESSTLEEVTLKLVITLYTFSYLQMQNKEAEKERYKEITSSKDWKEWVEEQTKNAAYKTISMIKSQIKEDSFKDVSSEVKEVIMTLIVLSLAMNNAEIMKTMAKKPVSEDFSNLPLEDKINAVLDELNEDKKK